MITYDLPLPYSADWVAIVPAIEKSFITNVGKNTVSFRFGSSSSSRGMPLLVGDTVDCQETVYVRVEKGTDSYLIITGA